jgi:hypothetical protein
MAHKRRRCTLRQAEAALRTHTQTGWHVLPLRPRRPLQLGTPLGRPARVHTAEMLGVQPEVRAAYLEWLAAHEQYWLARGKVTPAQLAESRELVARFARNPPPC